MHAAEISSDAYLRDIAAVEGVCGTLPKVRTTSSIEVSSNRLSMQLQQGIISHCVR
jgi:hypothetical protein